MLMMHKQQNPNSFFPNDGLIFIHNGTILFTVSNPDNEGKDSEEKNLGHINSITSIGNTTKDKAKIGKIWSWVQSHISVFKNATHLRPEF